MAFLNEHDIAALAARESSAAGAQITPKADLRMAALWYARNGFPVFPLHSPPGGVCSCGNPDHRPAGKEPGKAGKHPRTPHGFKAATTDVVQIEKWWGQWPDSNIAIPTGNPTGTLVVDVDPRNGGDASLDCLIVDHGRLPDTAEQMTGGGGRHIVLHYSGGPVPKELAPGIDLKGDGGYIVVAPSVHASGRQYQWDGIEGPKALLNLAEAPPWLLDYIAASGNGGRAKPIEDDEKWNAGQRNNRLTSLGGTMRRPGMTREAIEVALLVENSKRCDPPLSDEEVRHIAKSVSSYEPGEKNNQGSASKTESSQKPALQLTSIGTLLSQPEEAVSWTLDGILPSGGLNLIIAKPKVGKSTWARCLAFAVAKGLPFMGRATEQGTVLYLALEEKKSEVTKHFRSLGATKDDPILIHCAHAPDGALLELRLLAEKHNPILIIVDPLLKLVRVRDANAYAEMTNALEPLSILARETGTCVVAAHHAGKAERAEAMDSIIGSSAIFGGIDTAILMKRTERYRIMQSQQRYGVDLPETVLDLCPETRMVALGVLKSEAETRRIGECILEHLKGVLEPVTEKQILSEIEGKQRTKWEALRDLYASGKLSRSGGGKRGDPYLYSGRVGENGKVGETENPADQMASLDSSYSPTPHTFGIRVGETKKLSKAIENTREKLLPDLRTGTDTTGNVEYEKRDSSVQGTLAPEDLDFLEF